MKKSIIPKLACLLTWMVSAAALSAQETSIKKNQTVGEADTLSVVHVGNSHSHPFRLLIPLTMQTGHAGFMPGDINELGASLNWIWNHPERNKWNQTLAPSNKWDAMTLLSWDRADKTYAPKFAGELFKSNPKAQTFIYVIWPDANMSFEKPDPIRTEEHGEEVAAAIATTFPQAPKPRVIPASLLMRELGHLADAGELPGVASRFELFSDGGHLNQFGQYAVNLMVCAMLYNESPKDYPCDIFFKDGRGKAIRGIFNSVTVPEDTATVIKRTVWDILQTYEPAGMKPGLVIANRRLDEAIAGQPFKVELKALNAKGLCIWSLSAGTLPAGITLSPKGIIVGQSQAVGKYPVNVKLVSGEDSVERPLVLSLNSDIVPMIPDQPLPQVSMDKFVFQPFKVAGGVGKITWSLSGGKLPCGIMLSPAGILVGTPGEDGVFTFKIKAEDSHPSGPRVAEKEFKWMIGPARPDSLLVKFAIRKDERKAIGIDISKVQDDKRIKIDGILDEPFWILDQAIQKRVAGTPEKKAFFSAVWLADCHSYGPRPGWYEIAESKGRKCYLEGTELLLAIKVLDGPKGKTPKDGIHLFLDGRHDGKFIYGADDLHFFIPRGWKKNGEWMTMVRGIKPPWFTKAAVSEIEGGYTVEISLGRQNLTGNGQWLSFGPGSVYGLDVAIDEGDAESVSQQVWRGDANNAEDTSHFGTIVLTGQPSVTSPPFEAN